MLTVEDEPDAALSYWQLKRRAGCLAALRTACYDQVLEEALQPYECMVDFLAVSPAVRGRGVGAQLMQWAEATAGEILVERVPQAVAQHGVLMTLWVAADNDTACRLYTRTGYGVAKRTGEAPWACLSSRVFRAFLGHPAWHKMSKVLPMASTPAVAKATATLVAAPAPAAIAVAANVGTAPPHSPVAANFNVVPAADDSCIKACVLVAGTAALPTDLGCPEAKSGASIPIVSSPEAAVVVHAG